MVATHEPPFWVCTGCNNVMEENLDGRCTQCQSFADCLEVQNEGDREIALAALGD